MVWKPKILASKLKPPDTGSTGSTRIGRNFRFEMELYTRNMTCPFVNWWGKLLFSQKRGLHRMFSLGTRLSGRWRPHVSWKIKNGYGVLFRLGSMTAVMTWLPELLSPTGKENAWLFFLFGKLSKPIMMGDRARGEYVQCYYGPVAAAKVVERPFITHFIWTMCDAGRKQDWNLNQRRWIWLGNWVGTRQF